ncbi:Mannosyl-oligosaccharide glucosidase GCS1 (Alpha-glucosidase 1) (Glucosidase 1) (Protein KNOPF) (Protein MUNCHKIN), partial [Durusdinium trenchii]
MKLSLKVYHFQELSRSSIRDAILERDGRYVSLKKELRENVKQLSPAQLVAAMVSCGRLSIREKQMWWDLARAVEHHTVKTKSGMPGLQHSQISLVLHALGKANVKIKERFYYRMLKLLIQNAEIWTEFDMAWILYGMRKRRLRPCNFEKKEHQLWAQVLRIVAAFFRQKLHFISPKGIVCILYEFAHHGIFPGFTLFRATRRIRRNLDTLNQRALLWLAVLLARFDWPELRLLKKYSAELRQAHRVARMHPQNMVVILHAYARLGIRDVELLKVFTFELMKANKPEGGKYFTMLAYSLGKLGVRGPLWKELSEGLSEKIDFLAPLDLALIAHSFGKAKPDCEKALAGAFSDAALVSMAGFTPKLLACLLDGFTLAGCLREDVFFAAMEEYIRHGSIGGRQRQQMMSRVLFSVMLERKHMLEGVSPAWEPLSLGLQTGQAAKTIPSRAANLRCCFIVESKTSPQRSLHGRFVRASGGWKLSTALAVHLLAEAEFCPLSGELLGPTHVGLRRKEWLSRPDTEARITDLEALLVKHVPLRRRPISMAMLVKLERDVLQTRQMQRMQVEQFIREREMMFQLDPVPLMTPELFPEEYQEEMTWGTYRPGIYFGVKGRHEKSFLFGLMWGSLDGKLLRHECESGQLRAFNWQEHDGRNYGFQRIEDEKLGHELKTIFVKEDSKKWHVRINTTTLGASAKAIVLFPYLGIEATSRLQVDEDSDWRQDSQSRSLKISGVDPVAGPFDARLTFRRAKEQGKLHHVSAYIQPDEADASQSTGVWDAKRNLQKFLSKTKRPRLPDSDETGTANWMAFQLASNTSLQVDFHVDFRVSRRILDANAESRLLEDAMKSKSEDFKTQMSEVFERDRTQRFKSEFNELNDGRTSGSKGKADEADEAPSELERREALHLAVASLLGGLGVFRGRLLVKTSETSLQRLPKKVLFTAVPSRSFFPRGFLWDEGFHGLILCRWHPRIFFDVLAHWLELQEPSGWIPREVPLGSEQEIRVPQQFLPQDPDIANPPSLLLPLVWLLDADDELVESLARQSKMSSTDFKHLVLSFSEKAFPRLTRWYAWLERSQRSDHRASCFRWKGRTAAHCLASGLDDYPRGLYVNSDECHLDLHSWMLFFARTLESLCGKLNLTSQKWSTRVAKLNQTLFEVFFQGEILADFIGRQPVSKVGTKTTILVTPPWRSDGRCGPQFPAEAGTPGECDPYGGAACCSPSGWCGGSADFCDCPGCRRFQRLEERAQRAKTASVHSPHLGYVSLFPLVLGHLPCDHPMAQRLIAALQPPSRGSHKAGELWSRYGVLSLSSKDPLFRSGEDYWRGKIWANLNYLTISALQRCESEQAATAFRSLKSGFVATVLRTLK